MWKQLLNKWLGREQCEVYVCSKHIDVDRLKDLVAIAYKVSFLMVLGSSLLKFLKSAPIVSLTGLEPILLAELPSHATFI